MKAMILSAGKGTRLGKITETIPKVLVDINGKSLLRRAVEKCALHGFDDIIINVHHFADMVEEEIEGLKKTGFRITVSDERQEILDTGGGLYKARHFFYRDPFLLFNADIITDFDLSELLGYHRKKGGLATLAVRHRPGNRYFLTDQEGLLCGWCNNLTGERVISRGSGDNLSEIAFSSMHIIDPEIFNHMSEGIYSMTSLYLKLASSHKIYTLLSDSGYWFNTGTPEILREVRKLVK
jgi:NDP-sugar pyrophosphorylase family protein